VDGRGGDPLTGSKYGAFPLAQRTPLPPISGPSLSAHARAHDGRLSAVQAQSLKKPDYYADGGNLYFRIAESGTRGWIFTDLGAQGAPNARRSGFARRFGPVATRHLPRLIEQTRLYC
jgi:hypothetical protein